MKRLVKWTQMNGIDFISYCIAFGFITVCHKLFALNGDYVKSDFVHDFEVLIGTALVSFFILYSIDSLVEFFRPIQLVNTLIIKLSANKITKSIIKFGRFGVIGCTFAYLDVPDTAGADLLIYCIFFFLLGIVAYSQYNKEVNGPNKA